MKNPAVVADSMVGKSGETAGISHSLQFHRDYQHTNLMFCPNLLDPHLQLGQDVVTAKNK